MSYCTEWDFTEYASTLQIAENRFCRHSAQQVIQRQTASRTDIMRFDSTLDFNAAWEILEIEATAQRLLRKYANTSLHQSCIKLYNGAELNVPELPEQDYFALATAKQELESRKRFLANLDYNLTPLAVGEASQSLQLYA